MRANKCLCKYIMFKVVDITKTTHTVVKTFTFPGSVGSTKADFVGYSSVRYNNY